MFPEALRKEDRAVYRRRLHTLLGIPEAATELQMHHLIVAGFPAQSLAELCKQRDIRGSVHDLDYQAA